MGVLYWNNNTERYNSHSLVNAGPGKMIDIEIAPDNSFVVMASNQSFEIFQLSGSAFVALGTFWDEGFVLTAIELVLEGKYLVIGGESPSIVCRSAPDLSIHQTIITGFTSITDISSGSETGVFAVSGQGLAIIMYYEFLESTKTFNNTYNVSTPVPLVEKVKLSSKAQHLVIAGNSSFFYLNEC